MTMGVKVRQAILISYADAGEMVMHIRVDF